MVLYVLLAAILDFLRDSWPGLRTWNSSKQKCYFKHESQVCVSAVHPDMMYNHDNWDFISDFGGHFVLQFWKRKTENRAWHGADLKSAYPNCVKTTAWQILLGNALQTLRMPLFEKWALTIMWKLWLIVIISDLSIQTDMVLWTHACWFTVGPASQTVGQQ